MDSNTRSSKIPYSKGEKISKSSSKSSGISKSKSRSGAAYDVSGSVHASLLQLGISNTSLEEFTKHFHGPLADALLFVSEHVRGRREVAEARKEIYRLREERSKSHIKHPDERDLLRTPADKALSVLSSTRKTVEITRQQVEDKMKKVHETQEEVDKLEKELFQKKRVVLLLETLEKREHLRTRRLEELGRLMSNLAKRTAESKDHAVSTLTLDRARREEDNRNHKDANAIRLPRSRRLNTAETLANLHAYHLRLSSYPSSIPSVVVSQSGDKGNERESKSKLRHVSVVKRGNAAKTVTGQIRELVMKSGAADVEEIVERLEKVAIRRVRQKMRSPLLRSRGGGAGEVQERLDETAERVKDKEKTIQEMLDRSFALAYLSEGYIRAAESFREQTAPVLRDQLDEETRRVSGWVDKLRAGVVCRSERVKREEDAESEHFRRDVMKALGLEGTMSTVAIIEHVEKEVRRNHDREIFLERLGSAAPRTRSGTAEERNLIERFRAQEQEARERAETLLRRKSDKADVGMDIVRDVEDVVRETRRLTG